jgi:hypothetical protein
VAVVEGEVVRAGREAGRRLEGGER